MLEITLSDKSERSATDSSFAHSSLSTDNNCLYNKTNFMQSSSSAFAELC